MSRVIESIYLNIIQCPHCNKMIQYEFEDIKCVSDPLVEGRWTVINCPNCNYEVQVEYYNGKIIR